MTIHELVDARELESHSSGGVTVKLFWQPVGNRRWVSVDDAVTGDAFTVEVCAGERARDVFDHPYAYAVARRTAPPAR
jgi:hypothetical protein